MVLAFFTSRLYKETFKVKNFLQASKIMEGGNIQTHENYKIFRMFEKVKFIIHFPCQCSKLFPHYLTLSQCGNDNFDSGAY